MDKADRLIFEMGSMFLYFAIFIVDFFWYIFLGEDTELNIYVAYLVYIVFYLIFSVGQLAFLTLSRSRVSKIIIFVIGLLTFRLLLAGYQGAAGVTTNPAPGLVLTRLIVLVIHSLVTLYAAFSLFFTVKLRWLRWYDA